MQTLCNGYVKSFLSNKAHTLGLVHHAVCRIWLVLIANTHGGMARLSWPGDWLHTKMVYPTADDQSSKY